MPQKNPSSFARDYHAALNYGDASGNAYLGVTVPLIDAQRVLDEDVNVTALRDFAATARHDQRRRRHRHLGDQRCRARPLQRPARAARRSASWSPM